MSELVKEVNCITCILFEPKDLETLLIFSLGNDGNSASLWECIQLKKGF